MPFGSHTQKKVLTQDSLPVAHIKIPTQTLLNFAIAFLLSET